MFLRKWVAYYGAALGPENLYLILDGDDQPRPEAPGVNLLVHQHVALDRVAGDKHRAGRLSDLAARLFQGGYDMVIATDIDEYLIADPATGMGLAAYLSSRPARGGVSALGLDVVQHVRRESTLDPARPWLAQRRFAQVSARYTKASIAFRPLRWGSGMHRIKGRDFHIDPNLYLIHTGMIDRRASGQIGADGGRRAAGWDKHHARREALFDIIATARPEPADRFFARARRRMTWRRPLYALNKPGSLPPPAVIELPERFRSLL